MGLKVLILITIGITVTTAEKKSYEDYKVYNVIPKSDDQVRILEDVEKSGLGESWQDQFSVYGETKIMVAPDKQREFLYVLKTANLEVTEVISNMQRTIDEQLNPANNRNSDRLLSMSWDRYYDLAHINAWLDELAQAYPNIVSPIEIGQSVENRTIKGVILNFRPNRENKLIAMIEGTLHSREWISTATVTYIIKEFLISDDPGVRALADNFEWHIFPVVNPDGYVYTFTTNRMWRKNRSTASAKNCEEGIDNDMSNGVDLNRNFDFMWMVNGASNDSCTNTYAGPRANSEPETRAIIDHVTRLDSNGTFIHYIAFHSYSQLLLIPYSHVNSSSDPGLPHNYADMYEIANKSADALSKRFGTMYRIGVSLETLNYPMSGASFDWVKGVINVPLSYLFELRDRGEYGFLLPASQIIPTSQEIMDALVEMDKAAINLRYYDNSASGAIYSMSVILLGVLIAYFNHY